MTPFWQNVQFYCVNLTLQKWKNSPKTEGKKMTKKVVSRPLFHKNVKKCVWKDNSQEMGSAGRPKMRAQNAHPPRTPKKTP